MTLVFLEACLRMAVGRLATMTDITHSTPTLLVKKVAQVVCDMMTLSTGTGENGLCDMLQVIT